MALFELHINELLINLNQNVNNEYTRFVYLLQY